MISGRAAVPTDGTLGDPYVHRLLADKRWQGADKMIAIFIAISSALITYYGLYAWETFTRCPARFSREWYVQEFERISADTGMSPEL